MTETKPVTDEQQKGLRRKVAAAKSYLSRLDNQAREILRSTQTDKVEAHRALYDKRAEQQGKFRSLVKELRQLEGREP